MGLQERQVLAGQLGLRERIVLYLDQLVLQAHLDPQGQQESQDHLDLKEILDQLDQLDHRVYKELLALQVKLDHREYKVYKVYKALSVLLAHRAVLVLQDLRDRRDLQEMTAQYPDLLVHKEILGQLAVQVQVLLLRELMLI